MRFLCSLVTLVLCFCTLSVADNVGRPATGVTVVLFGGSANTRQYLTPTNILSNIPIVTDDTMTSGGDVFSLSHGLSFTGFQFTAGDLPAASVIHGIEVVLPVGTADVSGGVTFRIEVATISVGGTTSQIRTSGTWDQTTLSPVSIGGPTNLWGLTLTRDTLVSNSVGLQFRTRCLGGLAKPRLDSIQMIVHFTPPAVTTGAVTTGMTATVTETTTGGSGVVTTGGTTGAVIIDCSGLDDCNAGAGQGECIGLSQCSCFQGWAGATCAVPVCNAPSCSANQTCIDVNLCICKPQYIPPACAVEYQCQAVSECFGRGICTSPEACTCNPGYAPPDCQFPYSCAGVADCSSHGLCSFTDTCLCDDGWSGNTCSEADCGMVGNCTGSTQGLCVAPNTCKCEAGWSGDDCSLPFTGEPGTTNNNVGLIAGVLTAAIVVLVVSGIIVAIFVYRTKKAHRGRKFTPPKHAQIAYGRELSLLWEASPAYCDKLPELMEVLLMPGFELMKAIGRITEATDADNFARNVVHVAAGQCHAIVIIKTFVDIEIGRTNDMNTLFRGNSLATKLFQNFSRIVGLHYLWDNLGQTLTDMIEEDQERPSEEGSASMKTFHASFEIDSSKMTPEQAENISVNKYKLMLSAQSLLTAIMKSADEIPLPLQQICSHAAANLPEESRHKAIGGFFFLRFIVPAIATPHGVGLFQEPPNSGTQRKLILLSKILQNIANNVSFSGKEEFMTKLNDIMEENREKIRQFFLQLSKADQSVPEPQVDIPREVVLNALCDLHRHITANQSDIMDELEDDQDLKKRLQKVLESLGDPPTKKK